MIGFVASFDGPAADMRRASPAPNVLDPQMLQAYWTTNKDEIVAQHFESNEERVVTPNYTMTFKEGVPKILAMLDDLQGEVQP